MLADQRFAAFIFDMDGVIIDSEPIHSAVKMDTFRHFGIDFSERDLDKYMGRTSQAIFADVLASQPRPGVTVDDLTRYKHEHYIEVLRSGDIHAIRPTVQIIHELADAGLQLAVATSSWRPVLESVIDRLRLRDCFTALVSGGDLPASKPDPAIYRLAAQELGVGADQCAVLEDTENGILAAKRAGMYCIAYRNPHSGAQDLSAADRIVDSPAEIKPGHI